MHSLEVTRADCGDLATAEVREWIVTNGLGGFASGTVAGTLTRRYHGLLIAARHPPVGRTLLCPKIDCEVVVGDERYALATDRWGSGSVTPQGYVHCIGFRLEGAIPVWTYACGDALLERRVWMEHDANRTYVQLHVLRARAPLGVTMRAFANHRDLHATTHVDDWHMDVAEVDGALRVVPYAGASEIWFRAEHGSVEPEHEWYRDFAYAAERERGLDDREDHLRVGTFSTTLAAGEEWTVAVADHAIEPLDGTTALARAREREAALLAMWRKQSRMPPPDAMPRLVVAADQFIVRRPLADDPGALSVIAGYPWFGDWGRDIAIALPGLALATGRPDVARNILLTFARFIDGGMLPNYFPDGGQPAEYNTVDAALWYIEAIRRYVESTGDTAAATALFPAVAAIIDGYTRGTRYRIGVDEADGLVHAGEPGVQLTWMDAKVGDWIVTPRIGKPIEINALWIAALRSAVTLAPHGNADPAHYLAAAERAERSFERFWNAERGYCFDVIDGPNGNDPALRPNQLFAVSLPINVLDDVRRRAIVDVCSAKLWTPVGLRSLDPHDPAYVGHYGGDQRARDGAYHQGTVWTWLAGPYALAHHRVYGDASAALDTLELVAAGLAEGGLGTLGEIADGDAPFATRGAIAQAWSVAAILDAWDTLAGESPYADVKVGRKDPYSAPAFSAP